MAEITVIIDDVSNISLLQLQHQVDNNSSLQYQRGGRSPVVVLLSNVTVAFYPPLLHHVRIASSTLTCCFNTVSSATFTQTPSKMANSNAPSSPVSSLSSLDYAFFLEERKKRPEDYEDDGDHDSLALPSPKRRKIGSHTPMTYDSPMVDAGKDIPDDVSDVSSDSYGSVQGTARAIKDLGMPDEDLLAQEQVRACSWEGCTLGELANLDELVNHLTDEHVNAAKSTKYTCQWTDCKAKGKTQMSAYALKAHLRSHTKEKPFYCALPECDRSFTRSDALAKHMRTVHENEAPKTLEHYSKNPHAALAEKLEKENGGTPMRGTPILSQVATTVPSKAPQKLKLLLNPSKASASSSGGAQKTNGMAVDAHSDYYTPVPPESRDAVFGPLPTDLGFTADEASMSRHDLFRLLRRQVHWAEQNAASLNTSVATLENMRRSEFLAKELALENALEGAYAIAERQGMVGAWADHGVRGMPIEDTLQAELIMRNDKTEAKFWELRREEGEKVVRWLEQEVQYATRLPLQSHKTGGAGPWYRSDEWKERKLEMERLRHAAKDRREEPGLEKAGEEDDVIDDAALLGDADEADEDLELPDEDPEDEEAEGEGEGDGNGEERRREENEYKRRYRPYGPPVDGAEYGAGDIEEAMDIDATAGRLKGDEV